MSEFLLTLVPGCHGLAMFRSAVLAAVLLIGSPIPGLARGEDETGESSPAAAGESDETETRGGAADLWDAASVGDVEAIERQLDAGADINARHPAKGSTPLFVAALLGHVDAVRVLLDRGADVNARGDDKGTALISAAFVGRTEVVELLIERGAKIDLRNKHESSALDAARVEWELTQEILTQIAVVIDDEELKTGREATIEVLKAHGAKDKEDEGWVVVAVIVAVVVVVVVVFHTIFMAAICLMIRSLLNSLPEEHRQLEMQHVWWLLVPCFNLAWNFFVFPKLARSFVACFRSQGSSDADGAVDLAMGYCIVSGISVFDFGGPGVGRVVPVLLLVLLLVKLYKLRRRIQEDDVVRPEEPKIDLPELAPFPRRHDLDALRSGAMLLGIALHAAISFMPGAEGGWAVHDPEQHEAFALILAVIHGFRLPLFFMISGFFTAMLWRRRGLRALIVHRCKRVLLPCLVGVATIIPMINAAGLLAGATVPEVQKEDEKGDEQKDEQKDEQGEPEDLSGLLWIMYMVISYLPIFHHLWFLWYLCWLVALFAIYARIVDATQWRGPPRWLISSPARYLWLVPMTMVPQALMGLLPGASEFGPDTAIGFIPAPHILLYYAVFFGFGALYFDCDDTENRLGRWWWITLPVTLIAVLPLALDFATGDFGFREGLVPAQYYRLLSVTLQVVFAWGMTFGLIGLCRSLLKRENRVVRYISDSSYWLYIAHLPLVLLAQMVVRTWPISAWAKFSLVCVVVTGILLVTYEFMVRYTLIGTMLNGKKTRPRKASDESPSLDEPGS